MKIDANYWRATRSVDDVIGCDVTSVGLDDVTGNTFVVSTDDVIDGDDDVITFCADVTVVCVPVATDESNNNNNNNSYYYYYYYYYFTLGSKDPDG